MTIKDTAYFIVLIANISASIWIIIITRNRLKLLNKHFNLTKFDDDLNWKIYISVFVAVALAIISIPAPYLITQSDLIKQYNIGQSTGAIGDTIGGIMNPFIALSGVIVTGLAFYIQYKANQQQRDFFLTEQENNKIQLKEEIANQGRQNAMQQFESRFYESLKLHRENISEMIIVGYDFSEEITTPLLRKYEKVTQGRKVFVTMTREFDCLLGIYKKIYGCINHEAFAKCYDLFFSGLDDYKKQHPEDKLFTDEVYKARRHHEEPLLYGISDNKQRKEFSKEIHLYFNYKPFAGHASRLGHYFRHLYLAVKSVVRSDIGLSYENKLNYLRLLRAQLSNHEQILLFHNWLSGYGSDWEGEENQFFTEYKMIHNLWYNKLFDDAFIKTQVDILKYKVPKHRLGNMFEIDSKQ